jgi:hypothetical protein
MKLQILMDLPIAESLEDPQRKSAPEIERATMTLPNHHSHNKPILLVESTAVISKGSKLKKKPSATGFFKQTRHNMFILQQAIQAKQKHEMGLGLPPEGPDTLSDYT